MKITQQVKYTTTYSIRKSAPSLIGQIFKQLWRLLFFVLAFSSCEEFFIPDHELIRTEDEIFSDWNEYRSAEMGLYSLQQNLVDQLFVLGELRGDLMEVTDFASPELIEVNSFNIQKDNPYASPINFYKLIIACNNMIRQLSAAHPGVLDLNEPVTNYDRLYGEALCMRAWAYFNAVRIYGRVPYIHETLNSVEDIDNYVNSPSEFTLSEYIVYAPDGYFNDTIRDTTIILEKRFYNEKEIIEIFTDELESNIKAVGVNHSLTNDDDTWSVTIWNDYARHVLLGQMYMHDQNYTRAIEHFNPILYNNTSLTSNVRFGLDNKYERNKWRNIFNEIDPYEHIYTIWFSKSFKQTNELQRMMSVVYPNEYMIKPTEESIKYWESIWEGPVYELDFNQPARSRVIYSGIPGDFYRGYGVSYKYYKDGKELDAELIKDMLLKKRDGNIVDVQLLMNGVDTVATKFAIGKDTYANDANFILYRAAGVHLYAAEIYAVWKHIYGGLTTTPRIRTNTSLNIINNGSYNNNTNQLGVRGRVGFANGFEAIRVDNILFFHDPVTNKIIDYQDYTSLPEKQVEYLTDRILEERAREMAFEGERFYDLVRIARRFNNPSILADRIASKFEGAEKEFIRQKLMDEQNWFIQYY